MANKRLALTDDGKMTYCSASDENIGKGRCNHVMHQKKGESNEDFLSEVSNYEKKQNRKKRKLMDRVDDLSYYAPGAALAIGAIAAVSLTYAFAINTYDQSKTIDLRGGEQTKVINMGEYQNNSGKKILEIVDNNGYYSETQPIKNDSYIRGKDKGQNIKINKRALKYAGKNYKTGSNTIKLHNVKFNSAVNKKGATLGMNKWVVTGKDSNGNKVEASVMGRPKVKINKRGQVSLKVNKSDIQNGIINQSYEGYKQVDK